MQKYPFLLAVFVFLIKTSVEGLDITGVPEFGCQWSGGSLNTGVTCTCHPGARDFFIQKDSIPAYDTVQLKIQNCRSVRFGSNAVSNMRNLRNIELSNIDNLYFEDYGLSWNSYVQTNDDFFVRHNLPTLKVTIDSSTIIKISSFTFKGQIGSIVIQNSLVKDTASFAFSSLTQNRNVDISNVEFINLQPQAFKRFSTELLRLSNSTFTTIPSLTFTDLAVTKVLLIGDCIIDTIRSSAFVIKYPERFEIINSQINVLHGEAFKVTTRGNVKIENNLFNVTHDDAFLGISLDEEFAQIRKEIVFNSDTFSYIESGALRVNSTSFLPRYNNVYISQDCSCEFTHYGIKDDDYEKFKCLFETTKVISLKEFKENHCSVLSSYSTIFIVIGVVLVLFFIICAGLLYYFKRVYRRQQEYLTDENGKPISLIMPDGKTYRETELHVIVERADLLTTDL